MNEPKTPADDNDIERERKAASDIADILRAFASSDAQRRAMVEEELSKLTDRLTGEESD